VRGFTRETTTALLTTIESIEWKREYANKGLVPVEHPRASTTDDVECFFSMVRDLLGSSFRLTTVMQEWRKICVEFDKRLDPQLPFYYYTSDHDRYYEGDRPSFNKPSGQPSRLETLRPARRELTSTFVSGRVSLVVKDSLPIRRQFHKLPSALPPPPALQQHNYC